MRAPRVAAALTVAAAVQGVVFAVFSAGCEQSYLDPMLGEDGSVSDALVCPFCADVSADAVFFDSSDASVYAVPPVPDVGVDAAPRDGGARDGAAAVDATTRDSG